MILGHLVKSPKDQIVSRTQKQLKLWAQKGLYVTPRLLFCVLSQGKTLNWKLSANISRYVFYMLALQEYFCYIGWKNRFCASQGQPLKRVKWPKTAKWKSTKNMQLFQDMFLHTHTPRLFLYCQRKKPFWNHSRSAFVANSFRYKPSNKGAKKACSRKWVTHVFRQGFF